MSDIFVRILEDAKLSPCSYAARYGDPPFDAASCTRCMFGNSTTCLRDMQSELLRRCKDAAIGIVYGHGCKEGGERL